MQPPKFAGKHKSIIAKRATRASSDHLYHLAFDTSLQANIISTVRDGKVIDANMTACKLLGYSKKELLTKTSESIFKTTENSFKKMLTQRNLKGYAKAHITAIKRNRKQIHCEITSVIFVGDHGITKSLTTIVDTSESIVKQKGSDTPRSKNSFKTRLTEKQIADALIEAHELERSEIGKELHDNVNQLLSLSQLYIDMARKDGGNKEIYLNHCSEYTLAAIEEIRKISKGLVTDVIKDFGLGEALNDISMDTMEVHPVKIYCTVDDLIENKVNDKFKHDVFRIVQEQLTNIIKHAKASLVKIGLSQNKNTITLSITDNGVGFDTTKKVKGIGIANIKSRANAYKGDANFVSQPKKGCVLNVTFPVTEVLLNKN